MNLLDTLTADYAKFPKDQSYDLYATDVFFKDPWTSFRGVQRYRQMIHFIEQWFVDVNMELHDLQQVDNQIQTRWALHWIAPVPWKPQMCISGRSELVLNEAGLIQSHIDYWDCSRWNVLQQLLRFRALG
jgi:Uncharacterized conserved protein (DUF2358)